MSNSKRIGLEKLAELYKKHDKIAEKEIVHHKNLKLLLDANFKPIYGNEYMERFERGHDFALYDHKINKIFAIYVEGHFHTHNYEKYLHKPKKSNVGYI